MSKAFNESVLRHPSFFQKLCLLAIDELHLVSEWREFRKDYFALGVLRTRLPDGIPFLGASATLDPKTLAIVKESCRFGADTIVMRTSLDRPEIYIQVSQTTQPITRMLDLQHVLPKRASSSFDIPKTLIFMETIAAIESACKLMRIWMHQLGYPADADNWVSPFFSDMATRDKECIAARFGLPSNECAYPRILIATDAYGLGIDNPDIARVWQWLIPTSLSKVYQRMGRALRCGVGQAHYTLLYQPWCVGPRSAARVTEGGEPTDISLEQDADSKKRGGRRADADRRRDLGPGIWDLLNIPDGGCTRNAALRFFEDQFYQAASYVKPRPCCSRCDPGSQISTAAYDELNLTNGRDSLRKPWLTLKLREWREQRALQSFTGAYPRFFPTLIMPDTVLTSFTNCAEYIKDESSMQRWVGREWACGKRDTEEILKILEKCRDMRSDKGEIFDAWVRYNDLKRGRLPAEGVNTLRVEFEERKRSWLIRNHKTVGAKKGRATKKRAASSVAEEANEVNRATQADHRTADTTAQGSGIARGNLDGTAPNTLSAISPRTVPVTPSRKRQVLDEVTPNMSRDITPSRSRQNRRIPSRYCD